MPGLLHADFLSLATRSEGKSLFVYVKAVFPSEGAGAITKQWSEHPVLSDSQGPMEGRVLEVGEIEDSLSDDDGGLDLSGTYVIIEDTDFFLASRRASRNGRRLRGMSVQVWLGSPDLNFAAWKMIFDGVLDHMEMASAGVWRLQIHRAAAHLRTKFPKGSFLPPDWPFIDDRSLYATPLPIIYGVHDSRNVGDNGLVEPYYVDNVAFRYLVSHGWVTVDRVYVDGVLRPGSEYAITHPTINGRLFTMIDWVADPHDPLPAERKRVTCDVTGFESVGNGTGSLLEGSNAILHLLTQFGIGDYQGGLWAATSSLLHTASFAAVHALLSGLAWHHSARIYGGRGGRVTVTDAVAEWCRWSRAQVFMTLDSKLGCAFNDHRDTVLQYDPGPQRVNWQEHEVDESFAIPEERSTLTNRVLAKYHHSDALGDFVQQLEVHDPNVTDEAVEEMPLVWSKSGSV